MIIDVNNGALSLMVQLRKFNKSFNDEAELARLSATVSSLNHLAEEDYITEELYNKLMYSAKEEIETFVLKKDQSINVEFGSLFDTINKETA